MADLPTLAARIATALRGSPPKPSSAGMAPGAPPFCLWLLGDLGAGKTTLAGHVLRAFGLTAEMPVTSPTYTYVNEYKIGGAWFAHLDLYRAGAGFSLEDLGIVDARRYAGFLVEWPTVVPASPALAPTHELRLSFDAAEDARRYAEFFT